MMVFSEVAGDRSRAEAKGRAQGYAGNAVAEHQAVVAHSQHHKPPNPPNSDSFPAALDLLRATEGIFSVAQNPPFSMKAAAQH